MVHEQSREELIELLQQAALDILRLEHELGEVRRKHGVVNMRWQVWLRHTASVMNAPVYLSSKPMRSSASKSGA